MKRFSFAVAVAAMGLIAVPALAQDFSGNVKARQGQFRILAINLGILGGMAKGEMPYDAATAQAAADSIAAVSMINQGPLWPQGSDNMSMEGTRALPAIWENQADLGAKWAALGEAAKGPGETQGCTKGNNNANPSKAHHRRGVLLASIGSIHQSQAQS